MTHVTSVIEKLGPLARYVFPLFVTFDPMRETAEVVAEYVSHFDERIIALTGTRSTIKAVQQRYGVLSIPGPKSEDGSYFISHTAAKYMIGSDVTHVQSFSHEAPPEQTADYLENIFSGLGKQRSACPCDISAGELKTSATTRGIGADCPTVMRAGRVVF